MASPESPRVTETQFGRLIDRGHKMVAYDLYLAYAVHERESEALPEHGAPLRKRIRALLESQPALQYDAMPLMRRLVMLGALAGTTGFVAFSAAVQTGLSVTTVVYGAITAWFVSRIREGYRDYARERKDAVKAGKDVLDKVDRVWRSEEIYLDMAKSARTLLAPVLGPNVDTGTLINDVGRLSIEEVLRGASPLRRSEARRAGLGGSEAGPAEQPSPEDGSGGGRPTGNAEATSTATPDIPAAAPVRLHKRSFAAITPTSLASWPGVRPVPPTTAVRTRPVAAGAGPALRK